MDTPDRSTIGFGRNASTETNQATRSDSGDRRLQGRPQQPISALILGLLDGRRVRCTAHLHGRDRGCEFDRHQSHRGLETRWSDCRGPATRTSNRAMDIVSRVTPVPIDAAVQPRFMHRACRVSGANATIGHRPRAVTRSRESPLRFEPRPRRRSGLRPLSRPNFQASPHRYRDDASVSRKDNVGVRRGGDRDAPSAKPVEHVRDREVRHLR